LLLLPLPLPLLAAPSFERLQPEARYFSEGASFGDVDSDGQIDAVSGPHWFAGPDFKTAHTFYATQPVNPDVNGYTQDNFFSYVHDVDGDKLNDIVVIPIPGTPAHWYKNPGGEDAKSTTWSKHLALTDVGNESPDYQDAIGNDGVPELWALRGGFYGYALPNPDKPTEPWTFHPITGNTGQHKYTHGMGIGDLDGDGRNDVLTKEGYYSQPKSLDGDPEWPFHKFDLRPKRLKPMPGGAQMHVDDIDGDGDADFVTSVYAHGYGLLWFAQEQTDDGNTVWVEHTILEEDINKTPEGKTNFSQLHAIGHVDLDGNGLKDLVTGKCWFAHGPGGDPDPKGTPYVYAFLLSRENGTPKFTPLEIDTKAGAGRQISHADVNNDKKPDLVIGNKLGTTIFLSK
ncbi:MAG: VCBS repeat-containing protein, partial [Verrucomicrobiales bacterium]|nr:VCBS repeat-containing protein [Verrucomicrobiales bacterium]